MSRSYSSGVGTSYKPYWDRFGNVWISFPETIPARPDLLVLSRIDGVLVCLSKRLPPVVVKNISNWARSNAPDKGVNDRTKFKGLTKTWVQKPKKPKNRIDASGKKVIDLSRM